MATTAHAFSEGDAIKIALGPQPGLHALVGGAPHQGEGARLGRENVAHQAVEHAGGVHHQPGNAVEHQRLRALGNVVGHLAEFLVHGGATGHEGVELLGGEAGHLLPALEGFGLHVQCRQERSALRKFPLPDVTVFHVLQQRGHGFVGVEKLPRQPGARLVHVEMHHAAAACKACELFGSALVVVQHDELGRALVDRGQDLGREREVEDVHRAPLQRRQVVHSLHIAMVQAHVFGLFAIVKPGRQGRAKAVGAATAVVQNQHGGIVFAGRHQQLQGKNGFAHCPDCRVCQRTACPKAPINPSNRFSILIAACA